MAACLTRQGPLDGQDLLHNRLRRDAEDADHGLLAVAACVVDDVGDAAGPADGLYGAPLEARPLAAPDGRWFLRAVEAEAGILRDLATGAFAEAAQDRRADERAMR